MIQEQSRNQNFGTGLSQLEHQNKAEQEDALLFLLLITTQNPSQKLLQAEQPGAIECAA